MRIASLLLAALTALASLVEESSALETPAPSTAAAAATNPPTSKTDTWLSLFDGKSLGRWKPAAFPKNGRIDVTNGVLEIGAGEAMAGIRWDGPPPARMNYEVELEAMRTAGQDFFCGLTFPVGDDPCTLICGGWGGMLVGLSSIDRLDASENSTTRTKTFDDRKWYKIKVRVTPSKIEAWIDDEKFVNQELQGHTIGIRGEVEPTVPFGISTWYTGSALRNLRWRNLATPPGASP